MACQRCQLFAAASDVRAAADRALVATSKGRTRWRHAILANLFGRWKRRHHTKARKSRTGLAKKRTMEFWRYRLKFNAYKAQFSHMQIAPFSAGIIGYHLAYFGPRTPGQKIAEEFGSSPNKDEILGKHMPKMSL
ncbi:hypothetical protein VIGAN_03241900 [Vigna angularis var. angularis]|uniref:Uncharacterized protein n=1 Tax=Vigna angularis var. angularis TaxID=157739 RepID=A0A0S3RP69_PHAAN|nr:hypothetical protein VIGAN_03241900 [Vigna angularis var. angularis]